MMSSAILPVLLLAGIGEVVEGCESLKEEFESDSSMSLTYSDLPNNDVPSGSTYLEIHGQRIPLPAAHFTQLIYAENEGRFRIAALKDEKDLYSVKISFERMTDDFSQVGWGYQELLDLAYRVSPKELNCLDPPSSLVPKFLALLVKGLQFPIADEQAVYRTEWGWLRTGSFRGSRQIWIGTYQLSEQEFLEVVWTVPVEEKSFGLLSVDQSRLMVPAIPDLQRISACIEIVEPNCLQGIDSMHVKRIRVSAETFPE